MKLDYELYNDGNVLDEHHSNSNDCHEVLDIGQTIDGYGPTNTDETKEVDEAL